MARRAAAGRLGALVVASLVVACGSPGLSPLITSAPPTATASLAPTPTPALISKADAERAARAASDRWKDGTLLDARLGRYIDFRNEFAATASPVPRPDGPVWWINLGYDPGPLMGQGESFIVDAIDGHVIQHVEWIS